MSFVSGEGGWRGCGVVGLNTEVIPLASRAHIARILRSVAARFGDTTSGQGGETVTGKQSVHWVQSREPLAEKGMRCLEAVKHSNLAA